VADPTDTTLLREIDEELRQEHYRKLWDRYGTYLVAAAVSLVVAVAGYQGWRAYDLKTRTADSERFARIQRTVAADQGDAAREELSKLKTEASSGYRLLARFQEAGLLAARGEKAGAAQNYRELANDSALSRNYRDLAVLLEVLSNADEGDPAALSDRLQPLMAANNPWRHSARELVGILAQRQGNRERARETFAALAQDATAPEGVRNRAEEMLAILEKKQGAASGK